MKQNSNLDFWKLVGGVVAGTTTILGSIYTIVSPTSDWFLQNQGWLMPLLLILLLVLSNLCTFLFLRTSNPANGFDSDTNSDGVTDLATLWEREAKAKRIWIVSPELEFDVLSQECQKVVASNLKRNADYRYIVQQSEKTTIHMEEFKQIHQLKEAEMKKMFLPLPASELSSFLAGVVIYDADQDGCDSFGYPPAVANTNADVIVFRETICDLYTRNFKRIWLKHKGK